MHVGEDADASSTPWQEYSRKGTHSRVIAFTSVEQCVQFAWFGETAHDLADPVGSLVDPKAGPARRADMALLTMSKPG